MRYDIFVLVVLPMLLAGCNKPVGSWAIDDVEQKLVRSIPLDSVDLGEVSFATYEGTAIQKGENYSITAKLDHIRRSLTYSMKGATANQSQSGGFELFDRTQSLIFSVARMAIIVTAATLLGGYLHKTFGRKAVFKWGIIALLGSVVLLIAMVVLNLVQG